MSNKLSTDDRLAAIQKHCGEEHIDLSLEYDPVADKWNAWDHVEQLTGPCDSFGELLEALEADFSL